jgi:hypothetical protein
VIGHVVIGSVVVAPASAPGVGAVVIGPTREPCAGRGVVARAIDPRGAFVVLGTIVTACPPRAGGFVAHATAAPSINAATASMSARAGVTDFTRRVYLDARFLCEWPRLWPPQPASRRRTASVPMRPCLPRPQRDRASSPGCPRRSSPPFPWNARGTASRLRTRSPGRAAGHSVPRVSGGCAGKPAL